MAFQVLFLVLLALVVANSGSVVALSPNLVVLNLSRQYVNVSSQVTSAGFDPSLGSMLGSRSLLSDSQGGTSTRSERNKFVRATLHRPELESYLSTTISLGNPGKEFELIVDTGSSISYVPCGQCKHCGKHMAPKFIPRQSKSSKPVRCKSVKDCKCDSAGLRCPCLGGRCHYEIKYAEGSTSRGKLLTDKVKLGPLGSKRLLHAAAAAAAARTSHNDVKNGANSSSSSSSSLSVDGRVKFGCAIHESGLIYSQRADGILGLSMSKFSLVNQLASARKIHDAFSVCPSQKSGVLAIGSAELNWEFAKKHCKAVDRFSQTEVNSRGGIQVPYVQNGNARRRHLYTLAVKDLAVGGTKVPQPRRSHHQHQHHPTVIDTGSTMSYLPQEVYTPLMSLLRKQRPKGTLQLGRQALRHAGDVCYMVEKGASLSDFPKIQINFSGQGVGKANQPRNFNGGSGSALTLGPHAYLYLQGGVSRTGQKTYCSLFQKTSGHTIQLGSVMLENFMLVFDNERKQLGIHSCDCASMSRAVP